MQNKQKKPLFKMNEAQVKEHFAKQASDYEALMVRLIPHYLEQHEIISNLLPDDTTGSFKVLDLGCGNGVLSEVVLSKLPGSSATAFDLTEDMLTAYKKKLVSYTGRFDLKQGDYRTDPIGEGYDICLAGLTLHHLTWDERKEFYKTLYDSMDRGGILISRDIIIDEETDIREEQYDLWKMFMASKGEDPEFWYQKHMEKDHPPTLADHFSWLKDAGFKKVACHWRYYNFAITTAKKD